MSLCLECNFMLTLLLYLLVIIIFPLLGICSCLIGYMQIMDTKASYCHVSFETLYSIKMFGVLCLVL